MIQRLAFLLIAAFWVAMNALLWRAEYGPRGSGVTVPVDLVCRKILTAPDASSLTVYQNGQRMGFCEFRTSVGQEMAKLDEYNPPPEGIVALAGYQIHVSGNVSLGDLTNRLRFDSRVEFSSNRDWRELNLKLFSRIAAVEIHSVAAEQTVRLKITSESVTTKRVLKFTDFQNPTALLRAFAGDLGAGLLGELDLPAVSQTPAVAAGNLHWEAHRARLKIGHELVAAYRLETSVLGQPVVIYVSTMGEILRAELPGGITVALDQWIKS